MKWWKTTVCWDAASGWTNESGELNSIKGKVIQVEWNQSFLGPVASFLGANWEERRDETHIRRGRFYTANPQPSLGLRKECCLLDEQNWCFVANHEGKKNNPKLIICCRTKEKKNNIKILTLISIIAKGVEHGHGDVDQAGQVEGDAPPQRDVAWEPEQGLIFCTNTTGSISTGTQNLGTQTRKCRCRPLNLFWNNNNQTLWVIIMISHPAASVCHHHHYLYFFKKFFKREPDSGFKDSLRIFFCHRISL